MIYKEPTIIHIGPDPNFAYGGMASLLNTYSKFNSNFVFISTTRRLKKGKEGPVIIFYRLLISIIKILFLLSKKGEKIIHIHTASNLSFFRKSIFINISYLFKAKIILHIHGGSFFDFYNRHPKFVKKELTKCNRIITIAEIWKNNLIELGFKNVLTLHNPIPIPKPNIININKTTFNILFLGTITENKGIWDILNMIKDHQSEILNQIQFFIGGNGEVDKLLDFIKINNLNKIVKYVGYLDEKTKTLAFLNSDLYIQPSYKEGLGMAIIEAMSYKLPVIASNTGGIPEIVKNNYNGFLIKPGDMEDLFKKINLIKDNNELKNKFKINSFKLSKSYFEDNVKNELFKLYKSL